MLRIGVVGAGGVMQRIHLPSLRALADVEVVALADLDRGLGAKVASAFGIPRLYGDVRELLDGEPDLQGVVVVTGRGYHASACLPVLERGLPVFTEKPLAATLADGRRMVEAAERSGAPLMVGYMKRYDPAVQRAQAWITGGAAGTVSYGRIHDWGGDFIAGGHGVGTLRLPEPPAPAQPAAPTAPRPAGPPSAPPTAEQRRQDAWGAWIEVWIHDVNLVSYLFGPVERVLWSREGRPKLALVRCTSGTEVLLEMGGPHPGGAPWDETVDAYGNEGKVALTLKPPFLRHAASTVRLERASGVEEARAGHTEAFTEEIRQFCHAIRSGTAPVTDGRMGLADLELAAAIVDAAHPGCTQPL